VSTTPATPLTTESPSARRTGLARRLFTLSGVVPLGVFVPLHLLTTATAIQGGARFDRTFARSPATTIALVVLVVLPLAFHGGYGAWLAVTRPRAANLPGWLPRLRPAASLLTLAFLVGHMFELPARRWTGALGAGSLFDVLTAHLSSTWHGVPLVALAYLVGVAATIVHFSIALWALVPSYGIVLSERGRAALAWGLGGGAVLLFVLASNTIVYFATGTRLIGGAPEPGLPDGPQAVPCAPASPK
jgi:succinate dehydrogenase/fumarate reductase cytochrome b subunit